MAPQPVRYRTVFMDSARWDDVSFRDGDIVISTPPKSGTTWTQMICALLIFQDPALPAPLDTLSPWVDMLGIRRSENRDRLAAQTHRRFLKTHTPLDGLPRDDRVTYVCVGRDPRDAALSWDNHMGNMDLTVATAMREAAREPGEADDPPPPPPEPLPTPRERFWAWVDTTEPVVGLAAVLHHLRTFWEVRHHPNMVLLHYDDLLADLAGQMRALAGRLGIDVAPGRWPELVRAATFDHMRRNADTYAPEKQLWHDPGRFFHRGRSGQWRELLTTEEDRARYAARVAGLAAPDLAHWAHHGRLDATSATNTAAARVDR